MPRITFTTKERKERDAIKARALKKQGGKCPICRFNSNFCLQCVRPKGPPVPHSHKYQYVNTFDHNHKCTLCNDKGCLQCFRGVLHSYCNLTLNLIEHHEWLQNDFTKYYIRGDYAIELGLRDPLP